MLSRRVRITIEVTEPEFEILRRAARRTGAPPADFVKDAAVRMARQDLAASDDRQVRGDASDPALPTRRSLRSAIERATMPTHDIVRQLEKHLGLQLLAITVGAEPELVKRWTSRADEPSRVHERRLQQAHEAWQLVRAAESLETTRAWWMGTKEELGGLSPAEAIALDRSQAVMAVARSFIESG